jgi:hypothetical protein
MYKAVPIQQRKLRFIRDGTAGATASRIAVTPAGLLALMGCVSAGAGTGTSSVSLFSGVRVRRVAVYPSPVLQTAATSTSGLGVTNASIATLDVAGGLFGPSRSFTANGTTAGMEHVVYVPKQGESMSMWYSWAQLAAQLNLELFSVTAGPGAIVDLDIEFTNDVAAENSGAFWTVAASASGIYYSALGAFDTAGAAVASSYVPFALQTVATASAYTLL